MKLWPEADQNSELASQCETSWKKYSSKQHRLVHSIFLSSRLPQNKLDRIFTPLQIIDVSVSSLFPQLPAETSVSAILLYIFDYEL
jgi:hypothetical protein